MKIEKGNEKILAYMSSSMLYYRLYICQIAWTISLKIDEPSEACRSTVSWARVRVNDFRRSWNPQQRERRSTGMVW